MSHYFRRMARVAEASALQPARGLFRPSPAPIEQKAPGVFEMPPSPNAGGGVVPDALAARPLVGVPANPQ